MVSFRLLASLIASTLDILQLLATLDWRMVTASSFRFFLLLPMSFWSSCAIIFVGVILPPSALFSVPTPLPSLAGSLRLFVFLREVFSLFFRVDFYSSLFFGVCPFHYWRPVFFLLWLLLFRVTVFISFALRLFFLSSPSSVSAPLLRCFFYTCCFCLLGGSPLTCFSFTLSLFSCPRFSIDYLLHLSVPPPPHFWSLDCLPRGSGCGSVCFLLPFLVFL